MKKLLVVFVKEFPYGVSEPFLELEYPLYGDYFDKVLIVTNRPAASGIRGTKTRTIDSDCVELLESEFNKNLFQKLRFAWSVITDVNFYKEIGFILKSKKNLRKCVSSLFSVIGKANLCVECAHKRIEELKKEGYTLTAAYGYWLIYPAYAAVKLKQKYEKDLYTISRAHRFDLYEYRHKTGYIPCRKYILEGLSEIASISEDGKRYLEETHPDLRMNITIQRLGAKSVGEMLEVENNGGVLKMVSCARVVPVKRISRIVDALKRIHDYEIEWTHVGDGLLLEAVREEARKLPDNIHCIFTDTIPNTEVYKMYAERGYHVFVNVSESEGVPVSIMEAMCFGTPVIATDVGGVAEMIEQGKSGYLLDENYSDDTLVEYLNTIHGMSPSEYRKMRVHARNVYETKYNAETNYRRFLKELSEK